MSAVYGSFREARMEWVLSGIIPQGMQFYVCGVNAGYTFSNAHESLTDLAGHVVFDAHALESLTYSGGVLDAADEEWLDLSIGDVLAGVVIYLQDVDSNTYLVCHINQSADSSIPGAVVFEHGWIRWSASGIVKL